MKTAIKIIVVLILLIVISVVGLFMFAFAKIDSIAKEAVERGGTYAMQVETTVEKVDVDLTGGSATMSGLNIANPDGFDTDHFFALANTSASVDIQSINSPKIIMPEITLTGIDVILDKGGNPSNYNKILENLQRFESDEDTGTAPSEGGKSIVIQSLKLQDINIRVANMPGVSLAVGDVAINIPEIELQNIGEKESMSAGDIINLVVKTVLAAAVEAGGGILPGDVLGELGNGLSGLTSLGDLGIDAISDLNLDKALGGVSEELGQAAEDITKNAQEQVDQAVDDVKEKVEDKLKDGLNNVFGNKKDGP